MSSNDPVTPPAEVPLVEQILVWSETALPDWQRDALRRLLQKSGAGLSDTDYDSLYHFIKVKAGADAPSNDVPLPWSKTDIPSVISKEGHATLLAMRGMKHVNRIVQDARLDFAVKGLTVIYGGNGSGKSGFARVLKRACRARDQNEEILPDATDPSQVGKVPEATFEITVGTKSRTLTWNAKAASPTELGTIAVFDSSCARAYLTTEGDIAYVPYGLDAVEDLANKVLPKLSTLLAAEIAAIPNDDGIAVIFRGPTKVGALVSGLNNNTTDADLIALATLSEVELRRGVELDTILKAADPALEAAKLQREAQRLDLLAQRIDGVVHALSPASITALQILDTKFDFTSKAAKLAAKTLCSTDVVLPGTGEGSWALMFDAARRYANASAYPDHTFPHLPDDAMCPLCQQDLGDARKRLERFDNFLKADTAQAASRAKEAVVKATDDLRRASLDFQVDASLNSELEVQEVGLATKIAKMQEDVLALKKRVLDALTSHNWANVAANWNDERLTLKRISAERKKTAQALLASVDKAQRQKLTDELNDQKARALLKEHLSRVTMRLSNIKRKAALEACRTLLQTRTISEKSKVFANQAVTEALRTALGEELKAIGNVHLDMTFSSRGDRGKTKVQLKAATAAPVGLSNILSEGEQRAIAISAFLAELTLSGHKGGIVFDDPVTSLDHERKFKIAERLSQEALQRQVIIFTHDLVFLRSILDSAKKDGATSVTHWIELDGSLAGKVTHQDSPLNNVAYLRTDLARLTIKRAEGVNGGDRVMLLRHAAGQLRRSLEELVAPYLFNNVIDRWREPIMMGRLAKLKWEPSLVKRNADLFEELSRVFEGHSQTDQYSGGLPTVELLVQAADKVDAILKDAKKLHS
jgi:energy-coupling factor transporter ATP-binding protein EcfA2